jgi:hypothetical protein
MRKLITMIALVVAGSAAHAQTSNSTTNCYGTGYSIQCNTTTHSNPGVDWNAFNQQQQQIQQQNQQNMNQAFANLGAAIAARRERKAQEKTAAAIRAALASDTAPASPAPTDEQPILLACNINNQPASIALYEKHSRVDTTSGGVTKTRAATFTTEAVSWTTPLLRNSLSRVDGSYTGYGNIPEVEGQSISGTCTLASQRKF